MKIKAVCEITGLTDRTIRYYIEEKLIFPNYTENYLGRKTFNFAEKDIDELNNIATLRKFDFTIQEIRKLLTDVNNSSHVIESVKTRTQNSVDEGQARLWALESLNTHKLYTMKELAEHLSSYSADTSVPNEHHKRRIGKVILAVLKTALTFIVVWLPIALGLTVFVLRYSVFAYPCMYKGADVYILFFIALLPSISVLVLSKIEFPKKKIFKGIMLVLCILNLSLSFFCPIGMISHSETTDIRNYRHFDVDCTFDQSTQFNDLFPYSANYWDVIDYPDGSQEKIYLDARYYYRYISFFDYTYDVYAEWPLEKDEFYKEVDRVKKLFKDWESQDNEYYNYPVIQKGNYTCLFCHYKYDDEPFTKATDNYSYYIFAYDETNLKVRYICCTSLENGADQPYYLELEWD